MKESFLFIRKSDNRVLAIVEAGDTKTAMEIWEKCYKNPPNKLNIKMSKAPHYSLADVI